MAGVVAVMNQKRNAAGKPLVGFANPLLYSVGSRGNGVNLTTAPLNQIMAPREPVSLLRGYANDLTELRVVTINSVPFNITTAPYALFVCGMCRFAWELNEHVELHFVVLGERASDTRRLQRCDGLGRAVRAEAHLPGIRALLE